MRRRRCSLGLLGRLELRDGGRWPYSDDYLSCASFKCFLEIMIEALGSEQE